MDVFGKNTKIFMSSCAVIIQLLYWRFRASAKFGWRTVNDLEEYFTVLSVVIFMTGKKENHKNLAIPSFLTSYFKMA